jgi:hypothetical protein
VAQNQNDLGRAEIGMSEIKIALLLLILLFLAGYIGTTLFCAMFIFFMSQLSDL